ncbi:MAG: FHIPEP family type III secretion protein [Lachnospiraceae bacterium]|nr:FHIPEP family type III secretion protein [Lachnospiraceae bacterium]
MSLDLFKERLSEARKEKGMTQAELARRLGVTAQAVSKWERGNAYPDIELLDGISEILDCSLDYLFQYEKDKRSYLRQDSPEHRAKIEAVMLKDAIELQFGYGLVALFLDEKEKSIMYIQNLRKDMAAKYGFCIPTIRVADNAVCAPEEYKFMIYGVEVASGTVCPDKYFAVNKRAEQDDDVEATEPVWKLPGVWTTETKGAVHPVQFMMIHLEQCIMEHLPSLFHCQIVADMVENVEKKYPKVVKGVVPERVSLSFLKQVLLILLCDKHYAVNHLIRIIEVLDEITEEKPTAEEAAERVAAALGEGYCFDKIR